MCERTNGISRFPRFYVSRDIYIYIRPVTRRRRRTSPRPRHTGECQKSGRVVKSGEIRENPWLRITTDPSEIMPRDSSRRDTIVRRRVRLKHLLRSSERLLSGPPSTSRLTLDPRSCSFSNKNRESHQSAGKRLEVLKRKIQTARAS